MWCLHVRRESKTKNESQVRMHTYRKSSKLFKHAHHHSRSKAPYYLQSRAYSPPAQISPPQINYYPYILSTRFDIAIYSLVLHIWVMDVHHAYIHSLADDYLFDFIPTYLYVAFNRIHKHKTHKLRIAHICIML